MTWWSLRSNRFSFHEGGNMVTWWGYLICKAISSSCMVLLKKFKYSACLQIWTSLPWTMLVARLVSPFTGVVVKMVMRDSPPLEKTGSATIISSWKARHLHHDGFRLYSCSFLKNGVIFVFCVSADPGFLTGETPSLLFYNFCPESCWK